MLSSISTPVLLALFAFAAGVVWFAGVQLVRATDALDERLGIGEALGGAVFLAFVTNLPEIAVVASGALRGDLSVAVGNLLGGIAAQTVVLALLDARGRGTPLISRASSRSLVIEAVLVLVVLAVCLTGAHVPDTWRFLGTFPPELAIAVLWLAGVFVISRVRRAKPSHGKTKSPARRLLTLRRSIVILIVGGVVTLAGGVALEAISQLLAEHWHLGGAVFGATVLAAVTSLPEISTGWAALRMKADEMAVSDVLGGNAFLPVLLLEASLLSGHATLPHAKPTDLYLAGLGFLLTAVYLAGLVFRPWRRVAGLGPDSLAVLVLYALGIGGLFLFP